MTTKPVVSIGLPVYNGEDYVSDAIESILNQTISDCELIISDNGSTDRTAAICRQYVDRDARIIFTRSETNQGAAWNYNRVFELSSGKYFRWLAADDLLSPDALEKCVAVMEEDPQIVLCFSWTQDIDAYGKALVIKQSTAQSDALRPSKRFWNLSEVRPEHNCEEVFGLIRSDVLRQTKLIDTYADSDRTLLAHLGLFGPFYEIPEALFLHRLHNNSSVVVNPSRHERMLWFDPDLAGKLYFPTWRQLKELFLVVGKSPVSWKERLICYGYVLRWAKRRRRHLRWDMIWAMKYLGIIGR